MTVTHVPGASYKIGIKDGDRVYLDVYTPDGPIAAVGEMTAEQARSLAQTLIANADKIDPPRVDFPCVVNDCPYVCSSYDDQNAHSREKHLELNPREHSSRYRYPGADSAGDFTWHLFDRVQASPEVRAAVEKWKAEH